MSGPGTPRSLVARVLTGALIFQAGIAALLVLGDMQQARFGWPGLGPDAPRLTEPVAPGDQRRRFRPGRDRPATQPARDPGDLPPRLVLTAVEGATYRLEGTVAEGDGGRVIKLLQEARPRPARSPDGSTCASAPETRRPEPSKRRGGRSRVRSPPGRRGRGAWLVRNCTPSDPIWAATSASTVD